MRKPYRISRTAEKDLDDIWRYVAVEACEETAGRLIDDIVEGFRQIARFPLSGRARNDIEYGVRAVPIGEFIVYYRPRVKAGVLISRIIHGARHQKQAWKKN